MKRIPINTTNTGEAFGLKFSYFKNASLTTLTRGGRSLPLHRSLGDVVGYINSSQDGAICHRGSIVPCLTSGHGNCPKIIYTEDENDTAEHDC